ATRFPQLRISAHLQKLRTCGLARTGSALMSSGRASRTNVSMSALSPSRKALHKLHFSWGDDAPAVKAIVGRITDTQIVKTGNALWNVLHSDDIPVKNVKLTLLEPVYGTAYTAESDDAGNFTIKDVPTETYVLHVEGGTAGDRLFDSADLL